jgi:hypothetical protein
MDSLLSHRLRRSPARKPSAQPSSRQTGATVLQFPRIKRRSSESRPAWRSWRGSAVALVVETIVPAMVGLGLVGYVFYRVARRVFG